MKFFQCLCLAAVLVACSEAPQKVSASSTPLQQALDDLVQSEYEAGRFHGSLVVRQSGQQVYSKSIGLASREWRIPMRPEHRFDIASMNKSFIAALTLKAVEQGHFQLQDGLTEVLDQLELEGAFHEEITIHQMLCHLSGLDDYGGVAEALRLDNFLGLKRKRFSNQDYVQFISEIPPRSAPGQQFYYSNFAYHLLCILIEEAFQRPFNEALQTYIAQPLGLSQTFASSVNEEIKPMLVKGYEYDRDQLAWRTNDFIDLTLGRRIFSTAEDLALWTEAVGQSDVLSADSWSRMLTNHVAAIDANMSYGYGWVIHDQQANYPMGKLPTQRPYFIHGGNTGGYRGITVNIDKGKWVFTILSNIGDRFSEMDFATRVTEILEGSDS